MNIVFHGEYDSEEITESFLTVIRLFKENYRIGHFREVFIQVTLVNEGDEDVELIDSETSEVFRTFEVHRSAFELKGRRRNPSLRLVIDNTK